MGILIECSICLALSCFGIKPIWYIKTVIWKMLFMILYCTSGKFDKLIIAV